MFSSKSCLSLHFRITVVPTYEAFTWFPLRPEKTFADFVPVRLGSIPLTIAVECTGREAVPFKGNWLRFTGSIIGGGGAAFCGISVKAACTCSSLWVLFSECASQKLLWCHRKLTGYYSHPRASRLLDTVFPLFPEVCNASCVYGNVAYLIGRLCSLKAHLSQVTFK